MLPSQFKRYTNESQPLVIDPEVAQKIGLNESIIVRQLHYWLKTNEKTKRNFYENQVWCYNTIREWKQNNFNFWSESTIKRIFQNLKKINLIKTIKNPKNKWDKTNWYTINYNEYALLFEPKNKANSELNDEFKLNQSSESNCTNQEAQNEPFINITETTSETTTERPPLQKNENNNQEILDSFLNVPFYPEQKLTRFPDLTDQEIKLKILSFTLDRPYTKFELMMTVLAEENTRKLKSQKTKEWYGDKTEKEKAKEDTYEIDDRTFYSREAYETYLNSIKRDTRNNNLPKFEAKTID